jgi:hypothetical protein
VAAVAVETAERARPESPAATRPPLRAALPDRILAQVPTFWWAAAEAAVVQEGAAAAAVVVAAAVAARAAVVEEEEARAVRAFEIRTSADGQPVTGGGRAVMEAAVGPEGREALAAPEAWEAPVAPEGAAALEAPGVA